ncbi:hypothetical protein LSM04_004406 [Trypanosoma melophagium]|uniref:uncharacterized protein n=1 Tax=Trypanosoma melophagium TaxID=715481 RepID=UPI00351A7D64|nr:hypothetical protein LSM04_004406 [Trypanosoma melophagium]
MENHIVQSTALSTLLHDDTGSHIHMTLLRHDAMAWRGTFDTAHNHSIGVITMRKTAAKAMGATVAQPSPQPQTLQPPTTLSLPPPPTLSA